MRNRMIKYLGGFLILIAVLAIKTEVSYGASATIEIFSDRTEVTVEEELYISIQIESDALFGDFEANLTYDDDVLDFMGGSPVATGGSGFIKINDMGVTEGSRSRKYALKFQALQVGTSEVSFSGRAMVYDYDTGREMPVSSNALTIKVIPTKTASTNAYLKSLKTSPSKISPDFDKNVLEYTAEVDYNTEKMVINAIPEDEKASVSISGNDSLKEGENKVIVKVLAESGNVIEYIIKVNRESVPGDLNPSENEDIEPSKTQGVFKFVRIGEETYAIYSGRYLLVEPGSDVVIPEGYIKTQLIRSDIAITAYAPANKPDSEFLLIYAVNEYGDGGFYQYDKIERTLQRYVPQISEEDKEPEEQVPTTAPEETKESGAKLNIAGIVIALLSGLCALLMVVVIRMYMKYKGLGDELDKT